MLIAYLPGTDKTVAVTSHEFLEDGEKRAQPGLFAGKSLTGKQDLASRPNGRKKEDDTDTIQSNTGS
jgi:hypothetical protein